MRYYNVWMDGPFEYLEPKFVEDTTANFLNEFQKKQKFYRQKIKKDLIENPVCKFKVRYFELLCLANFENHHFSIR